MRQETRSRQSRAGVEVHSGGHKAKARFESGKRCWWPDASTKATHKMRASSEPEGGQSALGRPASSGGGSAGITKTVFQRRPINKTCHPPSRDYWAIRLNWTHSPTASASRACRDPTRLPACRLSVPKRTPAPSACAPQPCRVLRNRCCPAEPGIMRRTVARANSTWLSYFTELVLRFWWGLTTP
jgi:hypothetical protein